jgi:hypothetical protein
MTWIQPFLLLLATVVVVAPPPSADAATSLEDLTYREYPRRTVEEAAVLEWGYSALISALDLSVAYFGPQTSDAALLEVECQPVMASPMNGIAKDGEPVTIFDNSDEIHGNMVIMTNQNHEMSGVTMAKIAKASGAAALLVVNIDKDHPDDIYRLEVEEGEEEDAKQIDIPVAMISLNSGNVLTTATVTPDMKDDQIVNNGMPDRVRLYAGDDRPFFEDVAQVDPTLFLIHNLLTEQECDDLIKAADKKVEPIEKDNILEFSYETDKLHKIERTVLWKGGVQARSGKEIEERIEQVTGFPEAHFSDFVVDRLDKGSYWNPHYDAHSYLSAMATITVFLTDEGSPIVYPSCKEPVKINPRKGMAIVHHNTNEHNQLDMSSLNAIMPPTSSEGSPVYIARKYVFFEPVSNSRRFVLPLIAAPFGGKLPRVVVSTHDLMIGKFGVEQGGSYFDRLCVFLPVLLLLGLAQFISDKVQAKMKNNQSGKAKSSTPSKSPKKGKKD